MRCGITEYWGVVGECPGGQCVAFDYSPAGTELLSIAAVDATCNSQWPKGEPRDTIQRVVKDLEAREGCVETDGGGLHFQGLFC